MNQRSPRLQAFILIAAFAVSSVVHSAEPPEGFRAIFNGKDLAGWHGVNPQNGAKLTGAEQEANQKRQRTEFQDHWNIENSELVNDGHGPYVTSDEDVDDIEFLLEYKTVAKADRGIYLRGTPQVQIWDSKQGCNAETRNRKPHPGSGGLFHNTKGSAGRQSSAVADKPFGEWNCLRIRQIGSITWVWLSDKLVIDGAIMENYRDRRQPLPAQGPILLQTHGGEIRWRNLFVRDIGEEEAKKALEAICERE